MSIRNKENWADESQNIDYKLSYVSAKSADLDSSKLDPYWFLLNYHRLIYESRSVKLALILLQHKTVKLAAIFLQ